MNIITGSRRPSRRCQSSLLAPGLHQKPFDHIGETNKAESRRGFAGMSLCASHKTSAMRFGAAPEQGRQRENGHHFEAGNGPLIAKMNMKCILGILLASPTNSIQYALHI